MKNIKRAGMATASAALAAALMLGSCSSGADSGQESKGIEHGTTLSLSAGMQKIEENDSLILSVDKASAAVRIENKKNGAVWYTNPPNIDEDPIAENSARFRMQAQLEITAFDQNGQKKSYDSYTNCINKDQVTYEKVENGLQVIYNFGAKKKVEVSIPKQISEERFNKLFLDNNRLTEEEKEELKQRFRYDEQEKVYNWKTTSSEMLLNRLAELFDKAGYTEEDYRIDSAASKDDEEETETDLSVQIPVVYRLDGESLVVSVPLDTIDLPEGWYLTELSLLPFFGAAFQSEEGYLFVPDGSGALIDLTESLYLPLYGPDASLDIREKTEYAEQAVLPVYGLKKGSSSFLAIIEDGDAMGVIRGDRAGYLNSFYNVYSSYNLIGRSYISLGDGSSESQVAAYQQKMYDGDIQIRFLFQEGEQAGYEGMAACYRDYLQEVRGVKPASFEENMPFLMETVGAIIRNKSFLGFSYVGDFAMTTFEQNKEMIRLMQEKGVENLHLRLTGWMNSGLDQDIAKKIKPLSVLGGNGGFKDLLTYAGEAGVTVYPDVSFLTANKGHGFSTYWDAAKTIDRRIAKQYKYDAETGEDINENELQYRGFHYVVKPSVVSKTVDDFLKHFKKYQQNGANALSLGDFGSSIFSDFNEKETVDRQTAANQYRELIKKLAAQTEEALLITKGNANAIDYASFVAQAPMGYSGYLVEDREVPFFQLVYHGLLSYTGEALNTSSSYRQDLLKAIEYGSCPYYQWTWESSSKAKDSNFSFLFSTEFSQWAEGAAEYYQRANEALGPLQALQMVSNRTLEGGVKETAYEDGTRILVNYGTKDAVVSGVTVPAEDFVVIKGAE